MTAPGDCERHHKSQNNCPKVFGAMATGSTSADGSRKLSDFEDDSHHADVPSKKHFKPTRECFRNEMERRAMNASLNMKKFKKRSMTRQQALTWLLDNPIGDPVDVAFLRKEEASLCKTIVEAAAEAEQMKKDKLLAGNWTGNLPWLRLCCAMCEDDCRQALADWNCSLAREELDARNSTARPMSCWEKVFNEHNNASWKVLTDALPDLHGDFAETIVLQSEDMPGGPLGSAEDARKKGAEARAKLMQVRT